MLYEKSKVAEFQMAFETPSTTDFWIGLVAEEMTETEEALAHLLKEISDLDYVIAGLANVTDFEAVRRDPRVQTLMARAARTRDALEEIGQTSSDIRAAAFDRIHASNMSKLGDDGQPVRREDGKILKGPNYQPPVLIDLITE